MIDLLRHTPLLQLLKSVDEGIARTEASFRTAIADSVFHDLMGAVYELCLL